MKLFKLVDIECYQNEAKNSTMHCLCAVGDYDENDKECIEWDENIFYWFDNHAHLESFKIDKGYHGNHEDFTVLEYKYREESIK